MNQEVVLLLLLLLLSHLCCVAIFVCSIVPGKVKKKTKKHLKQLQLQHQLCNLNCEAFTRPLFLAAYWAIAISHATQLLYRPCKFAAISGFGVVAPFTSIVLRVCRVLVKVNKRNTSATAAAIANKNELIVIAS